MEQPVQLFSWVIWFYDTFMKPLLDICKNTDVLGYSLFDWLISMSVVTLAVSFIRVLFGSSARKDD